MGIDTDGAAPREASARAARPAGKGGAPNALFLCADARILPRSLVGRIDDLRVILPWGSLLRSILAADQEMVATLSGGPRPGGLVTIVVSVTPADEQSIRPSIADASVAPLAILAAALERAGMPVTAPRAFDVADAGAFRSSWARRLGVPGRRPATILVAMRKAETAAPG